MKKIVALLFLCICSVFSVFGATVSVQIAEIDNPQGKTSDLSYILEDALLEYFFTRGVILSTSPVICNSQNLEKDFDNTIRESRMGQVDYLILLEVFFDISQSLSPEQMETAVRTIIGELPEDQRNLKTIMPRLKSIPGMDMKAAKNIVESLL